MWFMNTFPQKRFPSCASCVVHKNSASSQQRSIKGNTPRDPFNEGKRSKNAEDPCLSSPGSPASLSPTHEGPPATPRDPFKGNSIREAKSPMGQQEVQIDEGDFIELEAEGQDSEFPDDITRNESPLKKKLEALQEKVRKQEKETKKLKAKNKKLKEQVTNQKGSHSHKCQSTIAEEH